MKARLQLHFHEIWSWGTPIYRDFGGKIMYVRRILSLISLNPLEIDWTWIVFGSVGEIFLVAIIAIIWLNQKVGHEQDGPKDEYD
jgi:hypothetical protein